MKLMRVVFSYKNEVYYTIFERTTSTVLYSDKIMSCNIKDSYLITSADRWWLYGQGRMYGCGRIGPDSHPKVEKVEEFYWSLNF